MSNESKPWQRADVSVTLELVRDLLSSVAPSLREVVYLHEGWDSRAFLVDGEWIFRFPKRAACAERLRCEIALLPLLAPQLLPVAIPRFEYVGQPSEQYPYPFVGYRKLPGEPLFFREDTDPVDACAIAADLGRLCGALHGSSKEQALAAGVKQASWYADHEALAAAAMERLREVWTAVPEAPREHLAAALAEMPSPYTGPPVLCHSDIAPEHLLGDAAGKRLLGLIDFGDMMLGDPAVDFAGAHLLGGALAMESALRTYPQTPDAGLFRRARFFAAYRTADDLAYGLGDDKPVYVRAALRALASL